MGLLMTPFIKQCIVTAGVAINMGQYGLVMSFTSVLLLYLGEGPSHLRLNDLTASWIAAAPGFTLLLGNITVPVIMSKLGRKVANLVSIVIVTCGWVTIGAAQSPTHFIIGRLLQGLSMGMSTSLGPILIGEYSSPQHRGLFLSTIGISMSIMTLVIHALGPYVACELIAIVCEVISLLNLLIVLFSPESPSWLADQGRYDKCRKAFHWLRGDTEEDELNKIIDVKERARLSQMIPDTTEASFKMKLKNVVNCFISTIKKKEFYGPIFIVVHMYMITHWGGVNLVTAYTIDTSHQHAIRATEYDIVLTITLDVLRIISNVFAVVLMKKLKRRTMLLLGTLLNIITLVTTALYSYTNTNGLIGYGHGVFGTFLVHVHSISATAASLPLAMVIAGEIFPMKYRSVASGIAAVIYSLNFFVTVKTVTAMFRTMTLHGTYCLYVAVLIYCLAVMWDCLPETKDKPLHEIEEYFKEKLTSGIVEEPNTDIEMKTLSVSSFGAVH